MNRILFLMMAISLMACQQASRDNYTLTGKVDGAAEGMVYLQDRIDGLMVNIDSVAMDNGVFVFNGKLPYPEVYYISIEGVGSRMAVFLENADITMEIDVQSPADYKVSGSASHEIFTGWNDVVAPFDEKLRQDEEEIAKAEGDNRTELVNELKARQEANTSDRRNAIMDYVRTHSDEPAAVFIAIRQLTHGEDHEGLRELLAVFDQSLEGTRHYDDLAQRVLDMERVAIGKPAPDFTLENTQGDEVSLSDFQGKYVLISFWASWCPYCREVNPDLVAAYANLKSDNFEILGVSLDRNHDAWIKGITDDGLTWPQVSDLKGWQSDPARMYVIRSIPQNVLISPDGIIVEKNLKYKEVEEKINQMLKGV